MKLKKFYELRTDFIKIGLTGGVGPDTLKLSDSYQMPNLLIRYQNEAL